MKLSDLPAAVRARVNIPSEPPKLGPSLPKGMNKLEADYARRLAFLQRAGEVLYFAAQPSPIRLADRCTYTPDFLVVLPGRVIRFDEVKGFERDDAIVKFKVAAEFTGDWFRMVKRRKGEWLTVREYNAPATGGGR